MQGLFNVFDWHAHRPIECPRWHWRGGASEDQRFPTRVKGLEQLVLISARCWWQSRLSSPSFSSAGSRRHVQQQCQQQLNYRPKGREAAPVRGQYPEDQGTKPSTQTRKTEPPVADMTASYITGSTKSVLCKVPLDTSSDTLTSFKPNKLPLNYRYRTCRPRFNARQPGEASAL